MRDENRRHHPRYAVELAAEITIGFETAAAATQNLSGGGVALALAVPLREGAAFDLTLFLTQDGIEDPDQEPFETKATVQWTRQGPAGTHLAGLSFGPLTSNQRVQLEAFLRALG